LIQLYRTNGTFIAEAAIACTALRRLLGLFHPEARAKGALLIYPCNSVHTFFMRHAIDVVFADKSKTILYVAHQVAPNRVRLAVGAYYAAELPSGLAKQKSLKVGDALEFQ